MTLPATLLAAARQLHGSPFRQAWTVRQSDRPSAVRAVGRKLSGTDWSVPQPGRSFCLPGAGQVRRQARVSPDVRKAEVAAGVPVGQPLVVKAQQG